jgi:hypothetical protein
VYRPELYLLSAAACLNACSSRAELEPAAASVHIPDLDANATRPPLCDRAAVDLVRDVFCGDERPNIHDLETLRRSLDLFRPTRTDADFGSGASPLVLLSHSTALSGALVSPLNPRVIMLHTQLFLAFNRGVQRVELIAVDRQQLGRLNFYLLSFSQACNDREDGCGPGDLFTPRIETDWHAVALQDDEDLKNTPSDCRQCHRRGRDEALLLMRELEGPWTHFFATEQSETPLPFDEPTGSDLLHDYLSAKADEAYGSIPTAQLRTTSGASLQNMVESPQPVLFDGAAILNERWPSSPSGFPSAPQRSATWDAGYAAFKRGDQLAPPFYATRVTDARKQALLTAAYREYLSGERRFEDVPDFADIFSDDPRTRAELGLQTEPGATPAQMLVQACGSCHNDVLDQSISRARFNIALQRMDRGELDTAIARLQLPRGSAYAMPPAAARQLDPSGFGPLIEYLEQSVRSSADDDLLEHAARQGMSSGASGSCKQPAAISSTRSE